MFELSSRPIVPLSGAEPSTGARVVFTGIVRDHNDGKRVAQLEYEAMPIVAEKEGDRIIKEAMGLYDVTGVHCVHRTGLLAIGEVAIQATVDAHHRAAAFDACRYVVEEVKRRVPIWKRETYEDGTVEWVNAAEGATKSEGLAVLVESKADLADWTLIDVRPREERDADPIQGVSCAWSPKKEFDRGLLSDSGSKVLLVCARGVSALLLADDLRREGFANVWSLTGGMVTLHHLARRNS